LQYSELKILGCLKIPYLNNLEVNKNYFKKELTSKNSLDNDYSALLFGSAMPGRTFSPNDYRFGYQGSEKDFDVNQGAYTTHFRMLDTRLGRWKSTDPITHPWQGSYTSMDNNPINGTDVDGAAFWHKKARRQAIQKSKEFKKAGHTGVEVESYKIDGYKHWRATGHSTDASISSKAFREKNPDYKKGIEFSESVEGRIGGKIYTTGSGAIIKDGLKGTVITGLTTDLIEGDLISYKNDFVKKEEFKFFNLTYLMGKDGIIKGKLGQAKVEGILVYGVPMDFKAGVEYKTNIYNPSSSTITPYAGIGTVFTEFKAKLKSPTSLEIRAGIQEDWSQTILNLNKQKFVATEEIRLQYHMKLELNFLKDWQPFGLFSK